MSPPALMVRAYLMAALACALLRQAASFAPPSLSTGALMVRSRTHVNHHNAGDSHRRRRHTTIAMGIKAVHDYDSSFTLSDESSALMDAYLRHPDMNKEVCRQFSLGTAEYVAGELFQPVPYSPNTPHGMPLAFEKYLYHDDYVVVNVPPVVMFKCKIFKPSRLCAVFRVTGRSAAATAELREQRLAHLAREEGSSTSSEEVEVAEGWAGVGTLIRQTFEERDAQYDDDDELDSLVV